MDSSFWTWPSTHILSWGAGGGGGGICKRAQYGLPRARRDNDGPGALYAPPGDLRHPRRLGILLTAS